MATYPLKNISIGGDTYQIQGGSDKYHCILSGPSVYDLVDINQFNNTNISTSYLAVVKNFTVVSNPGETLLNLISNDEQCVHLNYCSLHVSNLYLKSSKFTGTSADPIDFYFESEVYEDNGTAYVSQVVIRVSGTSPHSIISITGKKIACGGGGGGSSVTTYTLYDQYDQFVSFNVLGNTSIKLKDSNGSYANYAALKTAFDAGKVIIKDVNNVEVEITALGSTINSLFYIYKYDGSSSYSCYACSYQGQYWSANRMNAQ